MKILVTGNTGQVGWELVRSLQPLGQIIVAGRETADLSNPAQLRDTIQTVKPDVIVNAAAYTAVDKAESEPETANLINAQAPELLADYAAKAKALLIHYSTDYVFDGSKPGAYQETDTTCPINVYGHSKLAGELAIQAADCDYLIFRTSWVYASRGQNFVKTILRLAKEREELNIVADQTGAPTWARLIAGTTTCALKQALVERAKGGFEPGIFHLTASGETTWHGFAQMIVELAREQGASLLVGKINPIPASAYPVPAARPQNSRLALTKLEQRYAVRMPYWQDCLALCLQEFSLN
ncbi:MAG: dTDP-4-dehydrorhamnose reductase [Methylobacter sp.]|nr:MAG: dTDP-4-dehydrorhamnose reductase [Methylobacter sp.]